jgi:hypothetical protein
MNNTVQTSMGYGFSFQVEFAVCGDEVVVCIAPAACATEQFKSAQSAVDQTWSAATMGSWFQINLPAIPA